MICFFFQAEDGIRDVAVTGVQTCALPICTRHVQRLARENGLMFAPDPGASEQSQIGGNAATNAGGPHALKYGVTGSWVAGLEVALAPGELVQLGGWVRKD